MERKLGESFEEYQKRRTVDAVVDKDYLKGRMFFTSKIPTFKKGLTYKKQEVER